MNTRVATMIRESRILGWGLGACALGAAVIATGAGRAAAPEGLRGVWTADRSTWRVEKAGTTTLVQLTLRHVGGRAFRGELATLGYERVPMDKLIALRIHGASVEFIRGLAGLGYKQLPVDQLVALRIHGASLEFVRDIQGLGFAGLPPDKLVAFRIHGVTPDF